MMTHVSNKDKEKGSIFIFVNFFMKNIMNLYFNIKLLFTIRKFLFTYRLLHMALDLYVQ